uniref:(northern house mosquito) hypothetical protein n=1 Tax=Culex pipiens TaxID=7175 RepID=A0A8D8AXR1_CULPI
MRGTCTPKNLLLPFLYPQPERSSTRSAWLLFACASPAPTTTLIRYRISSSELHRRTFQQLPFRLPDGTPQKYSQLGPLSRRSALVHALGTNRHGGLLPTFHLFCTPDSPFLPEKRLFTRSRFSNLIHSQNMVE